LFEFHKVHNDDFKGTPNIDIDTKGYWNHHQRYLEELTIE